MSDCQLNVADNTNPGDEVAKSTEIFIHFEMFEQNFVIDDSEFVLSIKTSQLFRISENAPIPEVVEDSSTLPLSVTIPRTPLSMADRDQLRAMIVLLNESNSVLVNAMIIQMTCLSFQLKLRQRFPLSAWTRCDVIQCQIQMQLQELFGEFRSNDVVKFREMIPQNRQAFLSIWDHLSQIIVDCCYQQ
uniref:NR LBD domain-containing protein n=1 Tax=Caenorhabditis tropicalis TaxID=1561998 RepID=A0A1I7TZY4_9PELO